MSLSSLDLASIVHSMSSLQGQIALLGPEMKKSADRIAERTERLGNVLDQNADKLIECYDRMSAAQSRQQRTLVWLTGVIAAATLTYTWVTWQSVTAIRESNQIQLRALAKGNVAPPSQSK